MGERLRGRDDDHGRADAGYAMALAALILIPLLLIAGLAVDVGAWHATGTSIQRAADAASLAGVTFLPRGPDEAISRARAVAAQNGYTDGVDGVTVLVEPRPEQKLKVTITDNSVPRYLTSVVGGDIQITRSSTAQYILPVALGSPRNFLGTHRLMGIPPINALSLDENYWLAMSGYCASKEQGDRIGPFSDANFPSSGFQCNPGSNGVIANDEYRDAGYFYAVTVPDGYAGSLAIQAYDLPYCGGLGPSNDFRPNDRTGAFDLDWTIRDNNSLNPLDATEIVSGSLNGDNPTDCATTQDGSRECTGSAWALCWRTLHTMNAPVDPGIYFIQLSAQPDLSSTLQGTNQFALRAKSGPTFTPCTADSTEGPPLYSANCPNVFGIEHLGVYAGLGASQASFFLADIGPEHNGKTMEITLWDSGEGADKIQILDPNGAPVGFDWTILCQDVTNPPCISEADPSGGRSGTAPAVPGLDVSLTGPQPGPNRLSPSKYNDRHIRIEIPLPADILAAYSGRTWWKIQYTTGGQPTDRTTWSVIVKGDPVRLVPN